MMGKRPEHVDQEVAQEAMEAFHVPRPGWTTRSLHADPATWLERFVKCARAARIRERERIARSLCVNPKEKA